MTHTNNYTNFDYLRLMADGDVEMEKTMFQMLMTELPDEFEKIKALFKAGNWPELANVSHKMKSTLAFVGNEDMTHANKEIEHLAKHKTDVHLIEGLIATIEKDLPHVMKELENALKE